MIRLRELIRIPNPYPANAKPPVSAESLQAFRHRASKLIGLCVRNGVLNPGDAKEFVKKANEVLGTVEDLQHRLTLREAIDYGEVDTLRHRWKDEYRGFLRFRDTIKLTLTILVQNELIAIPVSDAVKAEIDRLYAQILEIDRAVQAVLRKL